MWWGGDDIRYRLGEVVVLVIDVALRLIGETGGSVNETGDLLHEIGAWC